MKRWMLIAFVSITVGLLAAACGSDPTATPTATPTQGPTATPTATPRPGEPTATPTPTVPPGADIDFSGKTIRIIVMYSPGGGYDAVARVVGAHLGKFLPGNPQMIIENRPGAGGVIGTNYAYTTKPDGFTVVEFPTDIVISQLVGTEGINFDFQKFRYMGALDKATKACYFRSDKDLNSVADLINSPDPIFVGGSSGSSDSILSALLKEELGANFTQVLGYQGTADTHIAIESGEVDGRCTTWSTVPASNPGWFETDPPLVTPVIQFTIGGADPTLPDVETIDQFKDQFSDVGWQTLLATIAPLQTYRTFALPPGADDALISVYREAFEAMYESQEFIDHMARVNRPLVGQTGADVEHLLVDEIRLTPEVKDNLVRLLANR